MSDEEQDDASKTEEPSHKKLEDARKKGKTVSTRELNHFFMLLAVIFFLTSMAPSMGTQAIELLAPFITRPDSYPMDVASVSGTLSQIMGQSAMLISMLLLLTIIAAIAPAILQGKWVFAAEQIKPKLNKLSPLAGFGRIFGKKALIEFLKNFIKIGIVGVMSVMVVLPYKDQLPSLLTTDATFSLDFSGRMTSRMLIATLVFLFLLSIIDYLYQRFSFMKQMRMTKQEVKDEYKQQEGDPHHKQKLKQMRAERARRRMMANVPKADVIITNPTHYAVALQYDPAKMAVPKVVAKGIDEVAARIREVAREHRVTIIRNPPLARLLYDTTEIDDEIPAQQYQAVAKIIGYVYRLKGKKPQQARPTAYKKPPPKK
jgi:flagellar biosynthetic protein FlhB